MIPHSVSLPTSEPLPKFSRTIDGYHIGARAREILCAPVLVTRFAKEAGKLYDIGWLSMLRNINGYTWYELSGRGEEIRKELRNA